MLAALAVLILFGAGLFVVLRGDSPEQTATAEAPARAGVSVFATSCSGCHGASGQGGINAPSLAGGAVLEAFPDVEDQIAVVSNGRANMPSFSSLLSAEEIIGVVDFTRDELADVEDDPESAELASQRERTAADLYGETCAFCHGVDGEGLAAPRIGGGATLITYPDINSEIAVVADGIGTMPSFSTQLSEDQLREIVTYTRGELPG